MPAGKPTQPAAPPAKTGPLTTLRNWFFAGVVVAAPIGITIWLVWSFVSFVDQHIKPLIPRSLNPETYLDFGLPGLGIVVAVVGPVVVVEPHRGHKVLRDGGPLLIGANAFLGAQGFFNGVEGVLVHANSPVNLRHSFQNDAGAAARS